MQTIQLQWTHPNKGEIVEEVCDDHHSQVHEALRILGIGCVGMTGKVGICYRCMYDGYLFREWIDQLL